MSERIRPPYRPDDDIPFGGERWGCFWIVVLIIGLTALWYLLAFGFDLDRSWLIWVKYLFFLIIGWQIGNWMHRKLRK